MTAKRAAVSLYDDDDDILPEPSKKRQSTEGPSLYDAKDDVQMNTVSESSSNLLISQASVGNETGDPSSSTASASETPTPFVSNYSVFSVFGARQGEREDMQDAHVLMDKYDFTNIPTKATYTSSLYAIFDGHAGRRAATHCEKVLPDLLHEKLKSFPDDLEKSLKRVFTEVFKATDEQFLNEAKKNKPVWKDGATATTALIINDVLYVANIGDTRLIVARKKNDSTIPIPMTTDHNPTAYEERMRIQKAGGVVKDGRVNGVIEVSRSIGDGHFKTLGVSCIPDMKKLALSELDRFIILACDGLWKAFSNEEAIKFVLEDLKKVEKDDSIWNPDPKIRERQMWERVANNLAAEAVKRKCGDNVSVVLIKPKHTSKLNEGEDDLS